MRSPGMAYVGCATARYQGSGPMPQRHCVTLAWCVIRSKVIPLFGSVIMYSLQQQECDCHCLEGSCRSEVPDSLTLALLHQAVAEHLRRQTPCHLVWAL